MTYELCMEYEQARLFYEPKPEEGANERWTNRLNCDRANWSYPGTKGDMACRLEQESWV